MINTLLEHVPIKMEVQDTDETNGIPVNPAQNDRAAKDDETIDETDEDVEAEDDEVVEEDDEVEEEDEEEDDEESDIETDALEIEKEATMLISSDEEAELEAQRIRFPDIAVTSKLRRASNISLGSSSTSRSSQTSNFSSQPHITYEIVKQKDCTMEEANNKQRISPRLKHMVVESSNKENKNNSKSSLLKQKTENKNLEKNKSSEGSKTTKPEESSKRLDNHKTTDNHKNSSENNRKKENFLKSPVNMFEQKSRRGSNNSTCSVASTVASDSAETESCGNIYVFNLEQKLIFNCEFCDLKYGDLENFGLHLHEAHKLFNFDEDPEKENAPRNLGKAKRPPKSSTVSVKKEPLQQHCVELKAEPPVALPPSALAEPLDSCGNVFMLNHRKLFLVCGYCESKYANLELFEKHLRQQHRIFEGCQNEVNVVPKMEVKEEAAAFPVSDIVDKPDIIIPQAMVAIPAEIPLRILSITSTDKPKTTAALEEAAAVEQPVAQTDIPEMPASLKKRTTAAKEIVAEEKMATALQASVEQCAEGDKEQDSLATNVAELSTAKAVAEAPSELSVNVAVAENELRKQKPVIRQTRHKRPAASDKQSESPNKRSKRKTRNNTRIEQESSSLKEAGKQTSAKPLKSDAVGEKEFTESNESQDKNQSTKSLETLRKDTNPENEKQQKNCKSTAKCPENKNAPATKRAAARETNKTPELVQKTARETKKGTDTEKISLKVREATEMAKPTETEKKTSAKLAKSRETRKAMESEKAAGEVKKAKKSVADPGQTAGSEEDSGKTTPVSLSSESRETRKRKESEKTPLSKLQNSDKTIGLKLSEPRELRTSRDLEKMSQKKTETRETRTAAKRAAMENPALETVADKKSALTTDTTANTRKEDNGKSETETSKFKCPLCSKAFAKKKSLIWHERIHYTGSNKRYGCGICGKDFLVEKERKSHMLSRHNADTLLECNLCYRAYSSKRGLERHNERIHAVRLFKCGECLRTYSSESSLKTHFYIYHKVAKKPVVGKMKNNSAEMLETGADLENKIKDDVNGETAEGLLAAIAVEREATESGATVIFAIDDINAKPINILDDQLSNIEVINLTESTDTYAINSPSSNTEQIIFVADVNAAGPDDCELVVELPSKTLPIEGENPTKSLLDSGREEDDATADPVNDIIAQLQNELSEGLSGEQTNNVVTYTINAMPNTEETEKSVILDAELNVLDKTDDVKPTFLKIVKHFVCDVCSKTYYKHSRLVEHKRLHTGEKPFGCDECGKQFRVRNRLNEHKQRHSKEKKFKCEICQLPLCTRQDYNLHMRHHTNDRRHQCSSCPKAFVRSSDLKIHERIHTGEKPYVCDICNKSFRANQNLSVHKKSHMGDISKTFKCEYCDKKFMRKIDRKVHMRTHTGERPYKCEICQRGYSSRVNLRAHIDRDHIKGNQEEKKKPGPKTRSLMAELERQKKLIEELQNQLLQQIKTDDKIILSDEEIQGEHILPDSPVKIFSPTSSTPAHTAARSSATTSKSLTLIPSPPLLDEPTSPPPLSATAKSDTATTILPLTITQKLEQASPASSTESAVAALCRTTASTPPSPPPQPPLPLLSATPAAKTSATKVVSQKTSLGIQQVSVTVSMQVENVSATSNTAEKDSSPSSTTSSSGAASVKKERKITSYFTVLDQKSKV